MWKIREITDKVTNVVMNYTEVETKVREATNDDPWGPTGNQMQDLAQSTFAYEHFPEVMGMLWKRMLHDKRNWRRTYKSLLVLGYLVKNGSERVVTSAREHIYDLRSLENYSFIDEQGKDQGVNVRQRVKDLIDFIQDDDRLREERKKAKKSKDKYIGMSSETLGYRYNDKYDKKYKDDFDFDINKSSSRLPKLSFGRRKSFEDSPDSNDEDKKSNDGRFDFKDEDSDSVENRSTKSLEKTRGLSKTNRKIDLGAAANFGKETKLEPTDLRENTSSQMEPVKNPHLASNPTPKQLSATNQDLLSDLVDFGSSANETATDNDNFADFSQFQSASETSQTSKHDEFGDFTVFSSSSTSTVTTVSSLPSLGLLEPVPLASSVNQSTTITSVQQPASTMFPIHQVAASNLLVQQPGPPMFAAQQAMPLSFPVQQPAPSMFHFQHAANLTFPVQQKAPSLFPVQQAASTPFQPSQNLRPGFNQNNTILMTGFNQNNSVLKPDLMGAEDSSTMQFPSQTGFQQMPSSSNVFANIMKTTNTWSNMGNVNINVEDLSRGKLASKPSPPSLNQMAVKFSTLNYLTGNMDVPTGLCRRI
ncbi:clathrin interactor 1-like isoform X2 [Limulus polyphemus]|uniref:Clathrin interactor 1-like isoform X2 n=1 Tax=Limulus polyphemus TaxID=6850 RepID=A0ABM1SRI9_LIMPO|nr:clathrin interactor 1-like isoform X2 [Limulus polyphemus]